MDIQKKNEFIQLRAIDGKSLETISSELGLEIAVLENLDKSLENDLLRSKAQAYDKILEINALNNISRFKHLVDIYNRLHNEIQKRDFSGLPTDKLYYMMNDVFNLIEYYKDPEQNT